MSLTPDQAKVIADYTLTVSQPGSGGSRIREMHQTLRRYSTCADATTSSGTDRNSAAHGPCTRGERERLIARFCG